MKKILPFIAVILILFTACNKEGDVFGGRYYGTFYSNGDSEPGSLSFTFGMLNDYNTIIRTETILGEDSIPTIDTVNLSIGGIPSILICDTFYVRDTFVNVIYHQDTAFMLNNVIRLKVDKKNKKCSSVDTLTLNDPDLKRLLTTMPAIDKLICESTNDTIEKMYIDADFTGDNVHSTLTVITSKQKPNKVTVSFYGSLIEPEPKNR